MIVQLLGLIIDSNKHIFVIIVESEFTMYTCNKRGEMQFIHKGSRDKKKILQFFIIIIII